MLFQTAKGGNLEDFVAIRANYQAAEVALRKGVGDGKTTMEKDFTTLGILAGVRLFPAAIESGKRCKAEELKMSRRVRDFRGLIERTSSLHEKQYLKSATGA